MQVHQSGQATKTIRVDVDIFAEQQFSNQAGSQLNFAFNPEVVVVSDTDADIIYALTEAAQKHFEFIGYFASHSASQLGPVGAVPTVEKPSAEVHLHHSNDKQALLVNLMLLVNERATGAQRGCDPQIVNTPRPR